MKLETEPTALMLSSGPESRGRRAVSADVVITLGQGRFRPLGGGTKGAAEPPAVRGTVPDDSDWLTPSVAVLGRGALRQVLLSGSPSGPAAPGLEALLCCNNGCPRLRTNALFTFCKRCLDASAASQTGSQRRVLSVSRVPRGGVRSVVLRGPGELRPPSCPGLLLPTQMPSRPLPVRAWHARMTGAGMDRCCLILIAD